jgi:cell division septal protein FtsQ
MLPLKMKRAVEAIKKKKRRKKKNEKKEKRKKKKKGKKRIKKKGAALLSFIHTCAHVLAPAVFIVIICAHV